MKLSYRLALLLHTPLIVTTKRQHFFQPHTHRPHRSLIQHRKLTDLLCLGEQKRTHPRLLRKRSRVCRARSSSQSIMQQWQLRRIDVAKAPGSVQRRVRTYVAASAANSNAVHAWAARATSAACAAACAGGRGRRTVQVVRNSRTTAATCASASTCISARRDGGRSAASKNYARACAQRSRVRGEASAVGSVQCGVGKLRAGEEALQAF